MKDRSLRGLLRRSGLLALVGALAMTAAAPRPALADSGQVTVTATNTAKFTLPIRRLGGLHHRGPKPALRQQRLPEPRGRD